MTLSFTKVRGDSSSPLGWLKFELLRGEFFGLAFVAHEFESTLGLLVSLRDFLLHLLRGLFHFRREPHVAIVLHAGAGGNQTSYDHIFLQTAQVVHRSLNGGFGEHARGLLERRCRDERVSRERRLRDAEQQWTSRRRL